MGIGYMSSLEKKIKKIQSERQQELMERWLKTPEGESWLNCVLAEKAKEQEILEAEAEAWKQEQKELDELAMQALLGLDEREWRIMQEEVQERVDRHERGEEKEKLLDSLEEMEKLVFGGKVVLEMEKEEKKEDPMFLRKKKSIRILHLINSLKKNKLG